MPPTTYQAALMLALSVGAALAQTAVVSGSKSRRTACRAALSAPGLQFPAGARARGISCADGGPCDADGTVNGVCQVPVQLCVNVPDTSCPPGEVRKVRVKPVGKSAKKDATVKGQLALLEAAGAAIPLPSSTFGCSTTVAVPVGVKGPNKRGDLESGNLDVDLVASPKGKGRVRLVCRPSTAPAGNGTTTTTPPGGTTTTTSTPGATTTTTVPGPFEEPGEGLSVQILGATVAADGTLTARVQVTDDRGIPVIPVTGSTTDPDEARIRLTVARLDVVSGTVEGLTTEFTRYRNYITSRQTSPITNQSSNLPAYDSGGTFTLEDAVAGIWVYTFRTKLSAGFDAALTHTIAGQGERTVGETRYVANPLYDFVPAGGAVTRVRELVTTQQCNTCHNPLEAHGGARREVKLCQVCHTDQGVDPDTGNSIDLLDMAHRIHAGVLLPDVVNGAIGAQYKFVGFQQAEAVFAHKVKACSTRTSSPSNNAAFTGLPCENDSDCATDSTCTSSVVTGVGFPRDLRGSCTSCHTGATAGDYLAKPSAAACDTCHSDVNAGLTTTAAGPPGINHEAGAQPDTLCRLCHPGAGVPFDNSVGGAHTTVLRSPALTGIVAELVGVTGPGGGAVAAGSAITVQFRLRNSAGVPYTSYGTAPAFTRIAFAASGSTVDYGDSSSTPLVTGTAFGSGSNGTLSGPDGTGLASYTFATPLPNDAEGTWTVGIEARRSVTVTVDVDPGQTQTTSATEAAQNVVRNFTVGAGTVEPRRQIVDQAKCDACHGTFSVDFSIHGGLRNKVDYCVVCHNPNVTDAGVRDDVVSLGASQNTETVNMKVLIHKTHTGEELDQRLYIVYGNRSRPVDLGEVRFPGDRRDCESCHLPGTNLLPLAEDLLPTRISTTSGPGNETVTGSTPPIQSACLSCHDTGEAAIHAQLNTLSGVEACHVCHGEGRVAPVSEVHRPDE